MAGAMRFNLTLNVSVVQSGCWLGTGLYNCVLGVREYQRPALYATEQLLCGRRTFVATHVGFRPRCLTQHAWLQLQLADTVW
jgi:hypothetical protein